MSGPDFASYPYAGYGDDEDPTPYRDLNELSGDKDDWDAEHMGVDPDSSCALSGFGSRFESGGEYDRRGRWDCDDGDDWDPFKFW